MTTAIIHIGEELSLLNDIETPTSTVLKLICKALKQGKAKKLSDTKKLLMYEIQE